MSWKYSGKKNSSAPNEKSMTKIVVVAPVKLRRLKKSKSTSGWAVWRSTKAKATKAATPPTNSRTIAAEPQPHVAPWISASVIAVSPVAVRSAPGMSTRRGALGSRDSGVARSASSAIRAATAMLTMKIQRQLSWPVSSPPTSTPAPETSSVAAPHIPIAKPRRSPVKTLVSSDIDDGISSAPPIPESAMPPISICTSPAAAASAEPPAKSAVPVTSMRRRPKTSASRPAAISSAANGM